MPAQRIAAVSISSQELEQIKSLLEKAGRELPQTWSWADYQSADVLLIDVDSVYGHMDWLKAQANGRRVLSLTNREGGEHEIVLTRPVTYDGVLAAFRALAADFTRREAGDDAPASGRAAVADAPRPAAERANADRPAADRHSDRSSMETPTAPLAAKPAVVERVAPPVQASAAAAPAPSTSASSPVASPTAAAATPAAAPAPMPEPVAQVQLGPIAEGTLLDFCSIDQLPQPARLAIGANPSLTLDLSTNSYFGPTTLKPLVPYCQGAIKRSQWEVVSPAVLQGLREAGGAQPMSRLLWLYTMVNSNGQLLPGLDLNARYKLTKWPQSEREYPKHFRIATAMMKGPAGLQDIAEASGAALADVIDFVNAYSVTGHVAAEGATAASPEMTQPAGLLSRLRARTKPA